MHNPKSKAAALRPPPASMICLRQYLHILWACILYMSMLRITYADELGAALLRFASPTLDTNVPRFIGSGGTNGAGTGIRAGPGIGPGSGGGSGDGSDVDPGAGSDSGGGANAEGKGTGRSAGRSAGRRWNNVIGRGRLGSGAFPPEDIATGDDAAVGEGAGEGEGEGEGEEEGDDALACNGGGKGRRR